MSRSSRDDRSRRSRSSNGEGSRTFQGSRRGSSAASSWRDDESSYSRYETSSRASSRASSAIDPNKPQWWNDQKKAERRRAEDERREAIRAENERRKMEAGNVVGYSRDASGRQEMRDGRVGAKETWGSDPNGGKDYGGVKVGAIQEYWDDDDESGRARKLAEMNDGMMMEMHDDRIGKQATADEELQGRSIWDLVDRSTIMVGCCLIFIVIAAISIPVSLISKDVPYVAPKPPPEPTASPTMARQQEEEAIGERLAKITPGGIDTLLDPTTAHHRAFQWMVYEDGMELGAAKDHLHQRYVLMVIYFISGPWTPVEGRLEWGSPVHECEWEGIHCKDVEELEDELEGRIEELLEVGREDGIKIDVPQRVANKLHLRQRLVSGEVPAEFSLLYYMQHLDLENNKLVGGIPTPLYKLFNLQTLFLEQNDLTNVDAIGEYRHLEHLSLSKNNFQGPLPDSFKNLRKLKTLYLHTNKFTGEPFDILKDFTKLELLDIAHNEFAGTLPPEFGNMKNLTSVFVGHNNFHGTIPAELGSCKNLKEFQVDASHDIGGPIPSFFGQLPELEFLKLDTCAFEGNLPMSLGNLQKLKFLDVNSNYLGGKIPTQLGKATGLVTLGLANNDFAGDVPSEFGKLTKLEKLYLQNTDLSGVMPEEVCELRDRGNQTVLEVLWVPCDVECDLSKCCTNCS
mmetsp:Transcript_5637/g.12356  ORF Transcript_5637/g.12356 Transcript_5637/m.12356 type:complete len:684 (+) Transcript_5637:105-2156(+)|eukprot:CAMPEP_0172542442 /NCGR_PEP_ID=MMETSP1067-20121228/13055_1 /TAXON_ID=265564 ORGANISM="Thalassiosira punctigera, Strain Tpunct2005C2" /NCGR_SAMPLE_ID=MMETSP1067 /ASSEMBLY_ACC=CAM_ASM_000444 /LENGTH=683 /DNA_ID=CAMNT_0013328689 /DNA_START=105 /DNA_END=2156 /DNA_ORIENTATION=-